MKNIQRAHTSASGFTLIETLIYLALFSIIVGGLCAAVFALFEFNERNATRAMLQEEAQFVLTKCAWMLNDASAIDAPSVGESQSQLSVESQSYASQFTICFSGASINYAHAPHVCQTDGTTLTNSNASVVQFVVMHRAFPDAAHQRFDIGITLSAHTPHGMRITYTASTTRMLSL